jgi:hypothetical protein
MAPSLITNKATSPGSSTTTSSQGESTLDSTLTPAQSQAFNRAFEAENHLPPRFKSSQITRSLAYTRQKTDAAAHAQREVHKGLDEILIAGWRKHYQHRVLADKAKTSEEKLDHLTKALGNLEELTDNGCILRGVLLAHSKALVHYEMGVLWT